MLHKLWLTLICDGLLAISTASRNRLRSASLFGAISEDFGAILGGFGRPKWTPNLVFMRFFGDVFFECVVVSILIGFSEARGSKNHEKQLFFQWFLWFFMKSTVSKKVRKRVDLGFVFGGPNNEKSKWNYVENIVFFEHRFLNVFFQIFVIFTRFWEAPRVPKILKKSLNIGYGMHLERP